MRKISILLALVASLFAVPAYADFTGKDASAATITFKNPGACTSVVCVPVFQIYDGTNVVTLTTAGADGVSNTLTGVPEYARMLQFNGNTWDRWQGAIKAASGAYAAGAFAAGAGVDGWDLTQGAIADAAVAAGATGSVSAKLRAISRDIGTVATASTGASSTGTGWTSATSGNSTQTLMSVGQGAPALLVQLNQTSTLTGGVVTFEGTYDNTNWVTIPVAQVLNPNTLAPLTNPYTLVASTNQPFLVLSQGYQSVRIRLSTVITGTATVTPFVTLLPYNPTISALLNPLAPGSSVIGKVGFDQTTPGTTNAVQGVASAPVVSAAAEGTHVLKGSAGNLFSLTTTIAATSGWVMVFDATTAPVDGAVTPKYCRYIKSDGTGGATSLAWDNPMIFSTGISVAFSSTGCFTKTASATAFFAGQVQ